MQGRFRGDVGLEAAHRAVLDLLGLLGHPMLALGRLRLRPQRALSAQLLSVALLLPADLRFVLGLHGLRLLGQALAPLAQLLLVDEQPVDELQVPRHLVRRRG